MDPLPPAAETTLPGEPLPAAVILHRGAAGGDHYDVLLAVRTPAGPDDAACATWRAAVDPAEAAPGSSFAVQPLPAHRALYLWLANAREIDGGRGTAVPVRSGDWRRTGDGHIEFRWADGTATRVEPLSITEWRRTEQ